MKVVLTGVLEDGNPRRPGVPVNPRATLNVARGTDLELAVDVVTPIGLPVNLEGAGTELLLTVKKRPQESPARIVKAASLNGNRGTFLIQPGDTRRLVPGLFGYDVWLTKDSVRDPVIPLSPFNLQEANAAVPDAPPPEILELVENDTEPTTLDLSPTNITGFLIQINVGFATPLVKSAVIVDAGNGLAEIQWSAGELSPPGRFAAEIQVTKPGPIIQTSPVFILDIRAEIA